MKRVLVLLLVLMTAVTLSVTAGGQKEEAKPEAGEREVIEYDTVKILWSDVVAEENCLYDQEILKKYGIKFNVEYLSRAVYKEKIPVMLATGEGIEVFSAGGPGYRELGQYALDGYLVPISDYLDKVPNYRKLFDSASWDLCYDFMKKADGKLYWLPAKRSTIESPVNVVRAGSFKQLAGFVPKTTDELYTAMKKVKAARPDAIVSGSWAAMPWYNVNSFRTHYTWYFDHDSKALEFGPATDKFRNALIYANKMYSAGLTDPEWTPAGKQHYMEIQTTGRSYWHPAYENSAVKYNDYCKEIDPDAGWIWTTELLTAYPDKLGMTTCCFPIHYGGPAITTLCPEEKIPRFLEYLNWSATDEGRIFQTFGIEGKTFEFKDGRAVVLPSLKSPDNPGGIPIETYGFGGWLTIESKDGLIARGGAGRFEVWAEYEKNLDKVHSLIAWQITEAEEKELADLETVIKDVWKEYTIKFITGVFDPNDTSQWDKYLTELKRVGYDKVSAIRTTAIKKSTIWP